MIRALKFLCCILLFPLVAGFSQAAIISTRDCVHCLRIEASQPDCCTKMMDPRRNGGSNAASADGSDCPHAGLCQGETDFSVNVVLISFPLSVVVPVSSSHTLYKPSPFHSDRYPSGLSPPPLKKNPQLYTLNCSYLI